MKILIGILLIIIGCLMIYFQLKKNIFYNDEQRDDFYVPPEVRGFWGIAISLILCGIILIIQNL
jgi:hypothetical protein